MGLAVRYRVAPDGSVSASFFGNCALESYPGVLHGGLVATLLDGTMTNCLLPQNIRAMTAELKLRYREPVQSAEELHPALAGVLASWRAELRATINQGGRVKAQAQAKFLKQRQ